MNIHESSEDYLEAILMLAEKNGEVRSVDIATELNYTKPSVCRAMKLLRENGYIEMDDNSYISLLPKGRVVAERIYTRHKLLTQYFIHLGVSEKTAAEDACRVEHDLSDETFDKIMAHVNGETAQ